MKRSRLILVVMLLLILGVVVFEISSMEDSGNPETAESGRSEPDQVLVATISEKQRSRSLSDRRNQSEDRYRAHTLNLSEDETLFLSASEFYPEENVVLNIHPQITEAEDGSLSLHLTPKIFTGLRETFQSIEMGELYTGPEEE
ncbi:MAG: hypothetical protein QNL33_16220 [Akkermansiaceae bacterium]|jgi:hypothetical protein